MSQEFFKEEFSEDEPLPSLVESVRSVMEALRT